MLPQTFIQSLAGLPGFNKETFIAAHEQGNTLTSIRLNTAKKANLSNHSFLPQSTDIPWCAEGRYLAQRPSFVRDTLWHAGAYYVKEASSMLLHYVLTQIIPQPGEEKVLDLCAAPGGKSTLLANYFPKGLLVANETIKSRNHILVENTTKWGAENIVVTQNDPAHFKALPNFFDVLVIDAPCSGSGLFRKDPLAINEWSPEHVQHCSVRQARILEDSIDSLNEGGYLIYATCSYSKTEDEGIMDYIATLPGMKNVSFDMPSEWGVQACFSDEAHAKGFKCFPDKVKGEGFFITVFKKEGALSLNYPNDHFNYSIPSKSDLQLLNSFFKLPEDSFYLTHQSEFIAIPLKFKDAISTILSQLYVKKMGITLGAIKGKDFIPAHSLAMSQWEALPYEGQEVDLETALNYLRRTDFTLPAGKGWKWLTYLDIPLGWVKQLPNRSNNYYPNEWRILNY